MHKRKESVRIVVCVCVCVCVCLCLCLFVFVVVEFCSQSCLLIAVDHFQSLDVVTCMLSHTLMYECAGVCVLVRERASARARGEMVCSY